MTWLLLGRLVFPAALLAVAVALVWAAATDRG